MMLLSWEEDDDFIVNISGTTSATAAADTCYHYHYSRLRSRSRCLQLSLTLSNSNKHKPSISTIDDRIDIDDVAGVLVWVREELGGWERCNKQQSNKRGSMVFHVAGGVQDIFPRGIHIQFIDRRSSTMDMNTYEYHTPPAATSSTANGSLGLRRLDFQTSCTR